MIDQYGRLDSACNAADTYPNNLIRTQAFRHSLQSYWDKLQDEHPRLFDPDPKYTVIHLWEVFDEQNGLYSMHEKRKDFKLTDVDRVFSNKLQKFPSLEISS